MANTEPTPESRLAAAALREAQLHELLADDRRRYVLAAVAGQDEPVAVADLARDIADREADGTDGAPSAADLERIHVDLYHVHLPKLAEAGLVEFDREYNAVASGNDESGESLAALLRSGQAPDRRT